ncbi:MAG TPA: hypothetical protein PLP17_17765 [Oligoflexia bacterium]|nr:hypothetical protein [Oligoflexia bacterium]
MHGIVIKSGERDKVKEAFRQSVFEVNAGVVRQTDNWDAGSPWCNSHFVCLVCGRAWVVYLPDQAWPGEVKVLCEGEAEKHAPKLLA